MASMEEMQKVSPEPFSLEGLAAEMDDCEKEAEDCHLEAPMDELFERPDLNRTTFLWQMQRVPDDDEVGDWERDDEISWSCLPAHWQSILNARLAQFNASVQDAEAFYLHRLDKFGADDIKTKNAKAKFESTQAGKGSVSAIIMVKSSGKEASPEIYKRSVFNKDGVLQVALSKHTVGYKLDLRTMTLATVEDEPIFKQLRVVSVTGRSREVQELRLHLTALSLQSSKVMEGMPDVKEYVKGAQKHHVGADCADDDGPEKAFALADQEPFQTEDAEQALVAHAPLDHVANPEMEVEEDQPHVPEMEAACKSDPSESEKESEDPEWHFEDSSAVFLLGEIAEKSNEETSGDKATSTTAEVAVAGAKFSTVPAFVFLEQAGLTCVPLVSGCGIGIHHTISTWQVRYPAEHQKSTARSFGNLKKGYVSAAEALLQCLLWAWQQHQKIYPDCDISKNKVNLLKGALVANLGFHVK